MVGYVAALVRRSSEQPCVENTAQPAAAALCVGPLVLPVELHQRSDERGQPAPDQRGAHSRVDVGPVPGRRHPNEKRRATVDEHSDDVRAAFLIVVAFLNCIYVRAGAPGAGV